jgi:ABC-type lipoprotein export system ATPase subunit
MIKFQDVSKTYALKNKNIVAAVKSISLEIQREEFIIITGRSGSGKTTLLNLAAGLTNPSSGLVLVDDVEIWRLPDTEQSLIRNTKIGFVFQFPSLIPSLTVYENVLLPTIFGEKKDQQRTSERALSILDEVGLTDKLDSYPRQLSAGQQQRAVVARALINQPELLLADEPTSNLDEHTEGEIMSLFKELHRKMGITILLVTHTNELVKYGNRSIHMADGMIVN